MKGDDEIMGEQNMATTEAQKRAFRKYSKANTKTFSMKLNLRTDADIIDMLESRENRMAYLKQLIRADIAKRKEVDMSETKIYAAFENEEQFGDLEIVSNADTETTVDMVQKVYSALPEFIQEQVSALGVSDDDLDYDVLEIVAGSCED